MTSPSLAHDRAGLAVPRLTERRRSRREVAGDWNLDVVHGIAVSIRMLGKPHYVAAEQVG